MERLCERPGCSERASVGYGMVAEERIFWLDAYDTERDTAARVLCRRHADSMVVPVGWTLDDRRDPELHLFRPPEAAESRPRRGRRRSPVDDGTEQLTLSDGIDTPGSGEDDADPEAWTPSFDTDDDLDGLLSAKSPLLARAFRGHDRPRRR
jgi:hypothetical protein